MYITWLGHSCFKIEEKIGNDLITVVTDPYDDSVGLRLPKIKADIISVSHGHGDHANVDAVLPAADRQPVVLDRPGEYEVKGVAAAGIGSYHDKKQGEELGKSVIFKFEIEGVKLLHLGDIGTTLSDTQLERIGDVDVMFVPVGGKFTIDAKDAAEIVRQVEPRIVIPMHYKIDGVKIDIDGVEKFKKEMGNKFETLDKLKITRKDLPEETTKLVILNRG